MLVLSRKVGERVQIGDGITVTVVRITNNGVRLGIEAPPNTVIVRDELCDAEPAPTGETEETSPRPSKPR